MLSGKLPRDSSAYGTEIQAPSGLAFQDASTPPNVSGGVTTQSALTIVPPICAIYFIFKASAPVKVGDNATLDGSASGNGFRTVAASAEFRYPCGGVSAIYLAKVSATFDLEFQFEILG